MNVNRNDPNEFTPPDPTSMSGMEIIQWLIDGKVTTTADRGVHGVGQRHRGTWPCGRLQHADLPTLQRVWDCSWRLCGDGIAYGHGLAVMSQLRARTGWPA
jgi:hypothetical protein